MKTQEEIERLAKQLCNIPIDLVIDEEERYYKNLEKYDGIIQGYTQCQEDMAKEFEKDGAKLFKSEIRRAYMYGQGNGQMMGAGLEGDEIDDYTNWRMRTLNKQD
jgi:hypothetical protein